MRYRFLVMEKEILLPSSKKKKTIYEMSELEFRNYITTVRQAIIPVGSLEQHGPHLPVSTDSLIAEYIARLIAEEIPSFVLPVISYGISYEHKPMFNVSIHSYTLLNLISNVCTSLSDNGIKKIILINGHQGNAGVLQYVAQDVYLKLSKEIAIYAINYWQLMQTQFDHAGEVETSLLLAIAPQLVKMDRAKPNSKRLSKSRVAYSSITNIPGSFPKLTGNGVWGDPRNATAKKGRNLLEEIKKNVIKTISELEV